MSLKFKLHLKWYPRYWLMNCFVSTFGYTIWFLPFLGTLSLSRFIPKTWTIIPIHSKADGFSSQFTLICICLFVALLLNSLFCYWLTVVYATWISSVEAFSLENSTVWMTHDKSFEMWICPLVYSLTVYCNDVILRLLPK